MVDVGILKWEARLDLQEIEQVLAWINFFSSFLFTQLHLFLKCLFYFILLCVRRLERKRAMVEGKCGFGGTETVLLALSCVHLSSPCCNRVHSCSVILGWRGVYLGSTESVFYFYLELNLTHFIYNMWMLKKKLLSFLPLKQNNKYNQKYLISLVLSAWISQMSFGSKIYFSENPLHKMLKLFFAKYFLFLPH